MTGFTVASRIAELVRPGIRRPMPPLAMAGATAIATLCWSAITPTAPPPIGYEVWLSEQADTQGFSAASPAGTHGGAAIIYDGADLESTPVVDSPRVLDTTVDLFPMADVTTGAHVRRLHGIVPSPDFRHMALNFVASGHLGLVDGESKTPVCLFRTTGTSTGRQNHMSFWTPDGRHIVVANQNGRILERVDVVHTPEGEVTHFRFNAAASIDLVGGAGRVLTQPVAIDMDAGDGIGCEVSGVVPDNQPTTTPNGVLKQAPGIRGANAVICPVPASTGQHVFVTLGGGGLFVVDVRSAPMAIVAEYDATIFSPAGCGGVEAAGFMHLNSGSSGPNQSEFTLCRLPIDYPVAPAFHPPNQPRPVAVWRDPDNGKVAGTDIPAGTNRDAHGLILIRNVVSGVPRYLHLFDRIRNNVEVFQVAPPWHDLEARHVGTYDLSQTGVCGAALGALVSDDPSPDLGDLSLAGRPDGGRIFVALRGPFPLTVAHAATGSCPGLGIVSLSPDRRSGTLTGALATSVVDFTGTRNLSDPHAAVVRLKDAAH
jgi:hypothetical protein